MSSSIYATLKKRIKKVVPVEQLPLYIFPNRETLLSKLEDSETGFDYKGIPLPDFSTDREVLLATTIDDEGLEKDTITDLTYKRIVDFPIKKEMSWEGLWIRERENSVEIYDDTPGLYFSIFILF